MNPDELLDRAAQDLRDQTRDAVRSGDPTLAQVLTSLRIRRRRHRIVFAALIPIGTLFFGLAGWAMVTGRWSILLPPQLAPRSAIAPDKEVVRRARRRPTVIPTELGTGEAVPPAPVAPPPEPEEPLPLPVPHTKSVAMVDRPAPRPAKVTVPAAPVAEALAPAPTVREPSAADELYRQAHEAHFVRRDYAAALVAWNRYVMLGPKARFFMEARYNRAIALVHLDRKAEAIEALRPFATSPPDSYRRAEARDLLRHLGVSATALP